MECGEAGNDIIKPQSVDTCEPERLIEEGTIQNNTVAMASEEISFSDRACPEQSAMNGSGNAHHAHQLNRLNAVASREHCHSLSFTADNTLARNQLIAVSILCFLFVAAEVAGGLIANSLAVATDATHLAMDLAGFLISLFAIWIGKKPATARMSFGFYRAEVVGALVSILLIWAVTAVLVYFAVQRVIDPKWNIETVPMLITASVSVAFNIVMGAVLHGKVCKSCHVSSSFSHGHSHGGGHGHSHNGDVGGGHGHSHNSGAQSSSRSRSRFANRQHINASGSNDDDDCLLVPENDNVATDPFGQYVTGSPDSIDDVLICNADDRNCNVPLQADSSARYGAVPQPTTEQTNINVRAAMIHVIGDFIQSVGVLVAALIIHFAGDNYKIADPICTFVFSFLVLCTTLYILRDILLIIMEGVPLDVDYMAMKKDLEQLPGVRAAHSLNAWSLTVGKVAVGVHLAVGMLFMY